MGLSSTTRKRMRRCDSATLLQTSSTALLGDSALKLLTAWHIMSFKSCHDLKGL